VFTWEKLAYMIQVNNVAPGPLVYIVGKQGHFVWIYRLYKVAVLALDGLIDRLLIVLRPIGDWFPHLEASSLQNILFLSCFIRRSASFNHLLRQRKGCWVPALTSPFSRLLWHSRGRLNSFRNQIFTDIFN
jgi:hypothetical protein